MTKAAQLSAVLIFLIGELLDVLLRPLWLTNTRLFQQVLDVTDCYPFRVCYDLGEHRQFWIHAPGRADDGYGEECFP